MSQIMIVCQGCARRYRVDSGQIGKLARCSNCDMYSMIAAAEPALPGGAIILDQEVEPGYNFLAEATGVLAGNIRDLFRMAGEPFTREKVFEFVFDLPRSREAVASNDWAHSHAHRVMKAACDNMREPNHKHELDRVIQYFIEYLPGRSWGAMNTLLDTFAGMLFVKFDAPELSTHIPLEPEIVETRRGTLVERLRAAIHILRHGLPTPRVEIERSPERRTSTLDD